MVGNKIHLIRLGVASIAIIYNYDMISCNYTRRFGYLAIRIKRLRCFQIKRTKDAHEDADLGKDNILRRSQRYLVYEKKACSENSPRNVLVELAIISSKDSAPMGFTPVEKTLDTSKIYAA